MDAIRVGIGVGVKDLSATEPPWERSETAVYRI
jgi:hypothetical protein